jgi:hypothetical protein
MDEEVVAYLELVDGHFSDLIYGMVVLSNDMDNPHRLATQSKTKLDTASGEYGEQFEKILEFSVELQDVLRTVKYKSGNAEYIKRNVRQQDSCR